MRDPDQIRKDLQKEIRESDFQKKQKEAAEADAVAAQERKQRAEELARQEVDAMAPVTQEEAIRAQHARKDFKDHAARMVEESFAGYEQFGSGLGKVMLLAVKGSYALNQTLLPWKNLARAASGGAKYAGQAAEAAGEKASAWHEQVCGWLGYGRQKGEVDLPPGEINMWNMIEIDADGRLTYTQKFADLPDFKDVPNEQKSLMDELFQSSVEKLLKKEGYQQQNGCWVKPSKDSTVLPELLNENALRTMFSHQNSYQDLDAFFDDVTEKLNEPPPPGLVI